MGGGWLPSPLVCIGLKRTGYRFYMGGSTEPSPAQEDGMRVSPFLDSFGRYGRFDGVTDRAKIHYLYH